MLTKEIVDKLTVGDGLTTQEINAAVIHFTTLRELLLPLHTFYGNVIIGDLNRRIAELESTLRYRDCHRNTL